MSNFGELKSFKKNEIQPQIFLMKVNCVCGGKLIASNKRKSFLFIGQNQINLCEWDIIKENLIESNPILGNFNSNKNFFI